MTEAKANLFKGMFKFRTQLKQPKLDGDNPFFKSGYVTLEGVQKAVDEALKNTGLSYVQKVYNDGNGGVGVETIIMHEEGESLSSGPLSLRPTKNDPQGYGSAITYAKRYQLAAMFGISSDKDDDGNLAANLGNGKKQSNSYSKPNKSEEYRQKFDAVMKVSGLDKDTVNKMLSERMHNKYPGCDNFTKEAKIDKSVDLLRIMLNEFSNGGK